MPSIAGLADAIRSVLVDVPEAEARPTGFVQRTSHKFDGPKFVQSLVFGWLNKPGASLSELVQSAARVGVSVTAEGLDDRFGPRAARLLKAVLDAAVSKVVAAEPVAIPLLQRFSAVILQDSSKISLPDELAEVWRGGKGSDGTEQSALKMQVSLDMLTGAVQGPFLEDGCNHDRGWSGQMESLPKGALRIADLGYFGVEAMQAMAERGVFFLSRLKARCLLFDEWGRRLALLSVLEGQDSLDLPVWLGSRHLPVRLLAIRVPIGVANERRRRLTQEARRRQQTLGREKLALAAWTVLISNAPRDLLNLEEALVLGRTRWQIELLFKLWKEHVRIDEWRSTKPWRILCETYAKLIGVLLQHWFVLVSCWAHPDRSLMKASQVVRSMVPVLQAAIIGRIEFDQAVDYIQQSMGTSCRIDRRRKRPSNYQLLLGLASHA